jgi:hypothetical protein
MRFRLRGFSAKKAKSYTIEPTAMATPNAGNLQVNGETLTMSVPGLSVVTIELTK